MQRKRKRIAARAAGSARPAQADSSVNGAAPVNIGTLFDGMSDPGFDLDRLFGDLAVYAIAGMLDQPQTEPQQAPEPEQEQEQEQAKKTGRSS